MTPPDFTLHIVLKEDRGDREAVGKIHGCIEKVTNRNVESPLLEPGLQPALNRNRLESAHRIGSPHRKPHQIVQTTPQPCRAAFPGAHAGCPRKLTREFLFISGIGLSPVVREKGQFVVRGQLTKDMVRTDIATAVNGQNLVRLDPEDSQPAFLKLAHRGISISTLNGSMLPCVRKQSWRTPRPPRC